MKSVTLCMHLPNNFLVVYSGGPRTNPIPYDADSATVKEELEALPTIAQVAVKRTPLDDFGGCTWTISFIEDETRLHRGDMPMLRVQSFLVGSLGHMPSIIVGDQEGGTNHFHLRWWRSCRSCVFVQAEIWR